MPLTIENKCDNTIILLIEEFLKFIEVEKRYSINTLTSYQTDIFYFFDFISNAKEKILNKNEKFN